MPERDRKISRSNPKTVRDGAVAAAIGVSLTLAMKASTSSQAAPTPNVDTPWVLSCRDMYSRNISDWQNQNTWGNLAGWGSGSGKWRSKQ